MAIRDIAGNRKAKEMMLAYAAGKKHGTAFMIKGEPNTGKSFAALQFAKAFNCLAPATGGDCCDNCSNCRLLDKAIGGLDEDGFQQHPHPDALYITTEKAQLSIDLLRNALSEANAFRALKLKKKIVIVADAERMNASAANSILKQLEEPKETLVTMLVVNNAEKILATIKSRCQVVEIKRAAPAEIKDRLQKAGFSGRDLEAAVLFSNGRIGEAYNHAKIKENIEFAAGLFRALAAKTDNVELLFGSLDAVETKSKEKKKKAVKTAEPEAQDAEKAKDAENTGARVYLLEILKLLANMYRDLLLERMEVKNVFNAKYSLTAAEFKAYTERGILNILKLIEAAQRDLTHNANIKVLFSALFFNIRKEGLNS